MSADQHPSPPAGNSYNLHAVTKKGKREQLLIRPHQRNKKTDTSETH